MGGWNRLGDTVLIMLTSRTLATEGALRGGGTFSIRKVPQRGHFLNQVTTPSKMRVPLVDNPACPFTQCWYSPWEQNSGDRPAGFQDFLDSWTLFLMYKLEVQSNSYMHVNHLNQYLNQTWNQIDLNHNNQLYSQLYKKGIPTYSSS